MGKASCLKLVIGTYSVLSYNDDYTMHTCGGDVMSLHMQ